MNLYGTQITSQIGTRLALQLVLIAVVTRALFLVWVVVNFKGVKGIINDKFKKKKFKKTPCGYNLAPLILITLLCELIYSSSLSVLSLDICNVALV